MFQGISWQSYWTVLALTTVVYYGLLYRDVFSGSIAGLLKGSSPRQGENTLPEAEEERVYSCIDELHAFFDAAKKKKWLKEELLASLAAILGKYSLAKDSGYQPSILNIIRNHSEQICRIHFSKEELDRVWLGV
jgi:hypothetical protein